jgi:hypothetical protein
MAGSIGMGVPLPPVAELANPVNRPGQPTLGADQAQQPHGVVVWASADFCDGSNRNQPGEHTPSGVAGIDRLAVLWDDHTFTMRRSDPAGRQHASSACGSARSRAHPPALHDSLSGHAIIPGTHPEERKAAGTIEARVIAPRFAT